MDLPPAVGLLRLVKLHTNMGAYVDIPRMLIKSRSAAIIHHVIFCRMKFPQCSTFGCG